MAETTVLTFSFALVSMLNLLFTSHTQWNSSVFFCEDMHSIYQQRRWNGSTVRYRSQLAHRKHLGENMKYTPIRIIFLTWIAENWDKPRIKRILRGSKRFSDDTASSCDVNICNNSSLMNFSSSLIVVCFLFHLFKVSTTAKSNSMLGCT